MVLQAVESKNIIASDDFLATLLETIKEGVLNCKIVCKDGKRSNDRSWRPAWAVLKKSGALFLCKEKKDNIMIPSVDSYPIDLKHSVIQVAHDYTKRKNVFKVNTFSNSEYLFQTCDNEAMMEWIREMQDNSTPPDLNKLFASETSGNKFGFDDMNRSQYYGQYAGAGYQSGQKSQQQQMTQSWDNNISLNSLGDQMNASGSNGRSNLYNKSLNGSDMMAISSAEDMFMNQSHNSDGINQNMSPIHLRKGKFN